jgi:hypothetical protein
MSDARLHLRRNLILPDGAFGILTWNGMPICLTLEHTYGLGPRGTLIVKIPPGEYVLRRTWFNRGNYNTWQVIGGIITPERRILIHKGNWESDSEGCILVGIGLQSVGKPGISYSAEALTRLMTATTGYDELQLLVTNCV